MSRKYEALIVLDTRGKEKSVSDLTKEITAEIEAEGATISESKQLGRKSFAYNARKLDGAHYVDLYFEAEPSAIDKIKEKLGIHPGIYMQYYQKLA